MHEKDMACRPYAAPRPWRRPLEPGGAQAVYGAPAGAAGYASDIQDNPAGAEDVARMAWGRYVAVAHCRRHVRLER